MMHCTPRSLTSLYDASFEGWSSQHVLFVVAAAAVARVCTQQSQSAGRSRSGQTSCVWHAVSMLSIVQHPLCFTSLCTVFSFVK